MANSLPDSDAPNGAAFVTTHWSVVLSAARSDSPGATEALEKLCCAYRYPLYAFVRRRGHDHHEAEDLTQEFLARLLEGNGLAAASPERGRFRSFLLGALKHFLANDWRKQNAIKRRPAGGVFSLDGASPEERYRLEPADHATPEVLFERRLALTVLERVKERLRGEFIAAGKAGLFDELKEFLSEKQPTPHADIAARHGMSASAVGVAIHHLRQRYGELICEEIAPMVGGPEEVEDEVRHLIAALGR